MISMRKAMETILDQHMTLETESVPLAEAWGRFLAESVASPIDSPPFDKSAMDGYAVLEGDESRELRVLETVAAGAVAASTLEKGACIKIMTGAVVPPGTGRVVRVEYVEETDGGILIHTPEPLVNIIRRGENLQAGEVFMGPKRLTSGDIGSLAASGIAEVRVRRRIRVGILATGSELKEPGDSLGPGEIYNSNGVQLAAQVRESGAEPVPYGVVSDNREAHRLAIARASRECGILLLSGGVSKGDFDYVPDTLRDAGFEIFFHRVQVKPGRPVLFGRKTGDDGRDRFVFGLPGNPVSVFVLFETMVKPLLWRFNSLDYRPRVVPGRLRTEIHRKDAERLEFLPIRFTEPTSRGGTPSGRIPVIETVRYMGSAHLNALVETEGFVVLDPGVERIMEGAVIDVRLI